MEGNAMTYDPNRQEPREPRPDREPYVEYDRDRDPGSGLAMVLGVMLVLAIGGFIYLYSVHGTSPVATNDMRPPITQPSTTGSAPAPETTGSGNTGSGNMTEPATPTPPAPPTPPANPAR
jgi:hypothetical protein